MAAAVWPSCSPDHMEQPLGPPAPRASLDPRPIGRRHSRRRAPPPLQSPRRDRSKLPAGSAASSHRAGPSLLSRSDGAHGSPEPPDFKPWHLGRFFQICRISEPRLADTRYTTGTLRGRRAGGICPSSPNYPISRPGGPRSGSTEPFGERSHHATVFDLGFSGTRNAPPGSWMRQLRWPRLLGRRPFPVRHLWRRRVRELRRPGL